MPNFAKVRVVGSYWSFTDALGYFYFRDASSTAGEDMLADDYYVSGPRALSYVGAISKQGVFGPNSGPVDEEFVFILPPDFASAVEAIVEFVYGYDPYEITLSLSDDGVTFADVGTATTADDGFGNYRVTIPLGPAEPPRFWTDFTNSAERSSA